MSTKLIQKILATGGTIQSGVYLQTSNQIISDQKEWADDDKSKHADFTSSKYWITTYDGIDPIGIDSDMALIKLVSILMTS